MSSHHQHQPQPHHHNNNNNSYGSAKHRSSASAADQQQQQYQSYHHHPQQTSNSTPPSAAALPRHYQQQRMNIEVGHFVVDLHGQVTEMSGDFTSNKLAVETLLSVVKEMRLHMVMKLTKDQFKVLTVQFPDHYYKVNFWADCADVRKYKMHRADLQPTGSPVVNV